MGTLTATLRKDQPDNNGLCRIIILYREGNETPIKYSVGEKVLPTQFDEIKQKVIKHKRAKEYNYLIEQRKKIINDIIFDLHRDEIVPTAKRVKVLVKKRVERQKFESIIKPKSEKDFDIITNGIPTPYEAWLEFMKIKKNVVRKATLSIYQTTLDHLTNYCLTNNLKLTWNIFDTDFYNHWNNYFIDECENQYGDTGLSNNTIGKYFKTLKTFLYWSEDKEYHENIKFKKYKVLQETIDIHPLSEAHLAKIVWFCDNEENDLSLRKVASLFIFLAATGLRYSDGQNLKWADLFYTGEGDIEKQILRLTSQKTNQKLMIPLSPYSIKELVRNAVDFEKGKLLISDILKPNKGIFDYGDIRKYFDNNDELEKPLMPQISSVNFNIKIKKVGEKCNFNEPISVTYNSGASSETKRFKRWEKLSSHDCRRTFITLSLEKGMRPETVMSFTGHTSYKTMLRYNKLTDKTKINEFHNAWGSSTKEYDDDLWGNIEVSSFEVTKSKETP